MTEYRRLDRWVLELVADLQEYEDTHPAAAPGEPIRWCMQPILDKVPEGVRAYAEGVRRARAEREDPGTLTGGQLCGGAGQLFNRPCPGCPDCAARGQAAVRAMAEKLGVPLAELPETGGHYGDWLGCDGQCDVWWDARVSKFVDWPRHLKAGAPRIPGIMRCVMALGHEPLPGVESGHNFGGLGPYTQQCIPCLQGDLEHQQSALCRQTHTPYKNCGEECCADDDFTASMPATQLQPDGTYEPVPAGPPLPRCPHCLQPAEPGHEERCQP